MLVSQNLALFLSIDMYLLVLDSVLSKLEVRDVRQSPGLAEWSE